MFATHQFTTTYIVSIFATHQIDEFYGFKCTKYIITLSVVINNAFNSTLFRKISIFNAEFVVVMKTSDSRNVKLNVTLLLLLLSKLRFSHKNIIKIFDFPTDFPKIFFSYKPCPENYERDETKNSRIGAAVLKL